MEVPIARVKKIRAIRHSISNTVRMLAGRQLQVRQAGSKAYVRLDETGVPNLINIPVIPDTASDKLLNGVQGYLDHEIGHVLFTDINVWRLKAKKSTPQLETFYWNILEDSFIEKRMIDRFKGSSFNLNNSRELMIDHIDGIIPTIKSDNGSEKEWWNLFCVCALRAMSGESIFVSYMEDKWHLIPNSVKTLEKFKSELLTVESTKEASNLSLRIVEALFGKQNPEDEKSPENNAEGKPSEGKPSEDESSEGFKVNEDDLGNNPFTLEDFDSGQATTQQNLMEIIISKIAVDEFNSTDYIPFTTSNDIIEPVKMPQNMAGVDRSFEIIDSKSKEMVGVLQKGLERAFLAMSKKRWESGRTSGKLNTSGLSRLVVGDDRVFRQRVITKSKEVAVSLLIDCSGSMSGREIRLAIMAAWSLSEVMDRLNISSEVIGFTTEYFPYNATESLKKDNRDGDLYSRFRPLYMPIFKTFIDRFGIVQKKRLAVYHAGLGHMSCNIDGECLRIAADRLMNRPESGKTIIVLSDGYPAGDGNSQKLRSHLKSTALDIEREGINVVGIGIGTDAPARFYRKHVKLDNIDDLPSTVLSKLREAILQP